MGIQLMLVAGAIILVIMAIFAPAMLQSLVDGASGLYTATSLKPRVGANEIICDLKIEIDADMIQDINIPVFGSSPHVKINSVTPQYFNCIASSNISSLDLIDFNHLHGAVNEASLLVITPEVLTSSVKIIDATDSTQQVSFNLQKQLQHFETFTYGEVINFPYDVSRTFVVNDIPARNYNLEINYDNSALISRIEDMSHGKPYIVSVSGL